MNCLERYFLIAAIWVGTLSGSASPFIVDPTVTIDNTNAFRDTYLHTAAFFGSDATLMVGEQSGSAKKRTIIKLDFSGSGIPGTATILNSQLQLYYYDAQGSAWADRWVQAHQVLKAWAEGQANRDNRQTGIAWGAQYAALDGTDASSTMESTMLFQSGQTGTWKSWNLTALTQKWINGTAANNGVILWATNEDIDAYDLRFYSRENATNQLKLVVTWSNASRKTGFIS